jgi:hypothetical protein
MNTPALTLITTREWDNAETRTVAALWRRRDGAPDTHLGQLLTGTNCFRFINTAEFFHGVLASLAAMNPKSPEEFVLVRGDEPGLAPRFIYHLWLNRPGGHENLMVPRDGIERDGIPYVAVYTPRIPGACEPGLCHYQGRLKRVDPEALAAEIHGCPLPHRLPQGKRKIRKPWLTNQFYVEKLVPLLEGPVESEE